MTKKDWIEVGEIWADFFLSPPILVIGGVLLWAAWGTWHLWT